MHHVAWVKIHTLSSASFVVAKADTESVSVDLARLPLVVSSLPLTSIVCFKSQIAKLCLLTLIQIDCQIGATLTNLNVSANTLLVLCLLLRFPL